MNKIVLIILFSVAATTSQSRELIFSDVSAAIQEGDLIFHKSQSSQSKAILGATGSEWSHVGIIIKKKNAWYVVEARNGVETTALQGFIQRGKNNEFKVFRSTSYDNSKMRNALYSEIAKYSQKKYDIYFEFSDDRIYCSELTYKVLKAVTRHEVGVVNKMKELRLDGPYVQELIKRRLTDLGKELNPEEPIVTPVSQMLDASLDLVFQN